MEKLPCTHYRYHHIALLFLLLATTYIPALAACTVCRDGSPVPLTNKPIHLPSPYDSVHTCGALDVLAPLVLTLDSTECQILQNLGTICGCPIPEEACTLCSEQSQQQLANPGTPVDFSLIPNGIVEENCEIAQA